MKNQKIQELLEQLRKELEQIDPQDEKGRSLLDHISADIHSLLEDSNYRPEEPLLQRLRDTIDHFKIEHPTLTMALSEMLAILSNAGI